jgi:HAD superfamily hydrolase (TIGR01484 family)
MSERQRPNRAYLFDIDGVLTDPKNPPHIGTETLDELYKRMRSDIVGFNTGQSLAFIVKELLDPLEAKVQDRRELHQVVAIGEKGAAWITYDQEGNRIEHIDDRFSLPEDFRHELQELASREPYTQVMFYDEAKKTMASVQIRYSTLRTDVNKYTEQQKSFVDKVRTLLTRHHLDEQFIVDPTRTCVDIESKHVGKAAGTRTFVELLKERGIEPEEFVCFGDSNSDYDMLKELERLGKQVTFVFVGGREQFTIEDTTHVIFTKHHINEGTLEYFRGETSQS